MAKRKAPPGLAAGGRRLWREISSEYELRPDEYRVLEDACRTADTVDRLHEALEGQPLTIGGVAGQPRPHPLIVEIRQQRIVLANVLKQLQLPEDPQGGDGRAIAAAEDRASKARAAAQARWGRGRSGIGTRT